MKFFIALMFLINVGVAHAKSNEKSFTVGVLFWSMDIPGQVAMRKGLEEEAKKINEAALKNNKPSLKILSFVAGNGESGIENQKKQMNDLLSQKVDGIVVQPTDNAALATGLLKANELNIPVVAYDQYIAKGKLVSYITSDNYQAGFYDGEYMAAMFADQREIKIVIVEYPYVSSTVERVDGFIAALKKSNQSYKIIKSYEAVDPIGGKKAGQAILKDFPDRHSIDVIFAVNDGGGYEVKMALLLAHREEIIFASVDGDSRSVELIKKNQMLKIDTAQFCGPMGAEAISVMYRFLMKENVARKILIPVFPITKETLHLYPGWLGPLPKAFPLPWKKEVTWNNQMKTE